MRALFLSLALALVGLTGAAYAEGGKAGAVKGQEVSVKGTMTCTFCKMSHPDKPCTADCCVHCIKSGDPVLLTDARGNQYVLLSNERGMPLMNQARYELLGSDVVVKGVLVKGKGVQAIFVEGMDKAVVKTAAK